MDYQQALHKLQSLDQSQLLMYWDALSPTQKQHLIDQIERLNPAILRRLQALLKAPIPHSSPIEPFEEYALSGNSTDIEQGQKLLRAGKVGCLLIAGGQGSRLHIDGPKGLFAVTPIKQKSLFQLFAEKTVAASKQAGKPLSLAIMTSPLNDTITRDFFRQHRNFGLLSDQLSFFSQNMLPVLDQAGNLFLENAHTIAEGPDGNGGSLQCFYSSGLWQNWQAKGIEYLNFVMIDNALADPFDAELIGYQHRLASDVTVKCTMRRDVEEKVGVLTKQNGVVNVIEYSEISEQARQAKRPDGTLLHLCANLSLFSLKMEFTKQLCTNLSYQLPLHKAFKAVKYLAPDGSIKQAKTPMCWKFEKFIFDIFPYASTINALLYPREECFAPLKNFTGSDSPAMVQEALEKNARNTLAKITGMPCTLNPCEIAQDFYYPTPELKSKWKGKRIDSNGYIEA